MPDNSFPHERILARENASFTCDLCNRLSIGLSCTANPRVYTLRERSCGLLHDQCSPPSECILNFHYSSKPGQSQFAHIDKNDPGEPRLLMTPAPAGQNSVLSFPSCSWLSFSTCPAILLSTTCLGHVKQSARFLRRRKRRSRNTCPLLYNAYMKKPALIVMSGLPGSGKSTIAERIAEKLQIPIFSVDPIESAMLEAGVQQGFETCLAAYIVAATLASEQLNLGISVVIDAVNAEEEGKNTWRELGRKYGLTLIVLEVVVSNQALHRRRIESRVRGLHGFSEVTWDQVEARRMKLTPWKEPTLLLDSTHDLEANVALAMRYIQANTL